MDRVQQGRSATLSQTFYSDGAPVAPTGTPTYTITTDAGTTVASGNMTGTGTGPYTITLTPTQTALLDWLTVTKVAVIGGQAQTYVDRVEVVGGFLFSLAEARSMRPLDNATTYSTTVLTEMRTTVEQTLEDACGVAFVPRYNRATVSGDGTTTALRAAGPYLRRVRWATVGTTPVAAPDLAALSVTGAGFVYGYSWTSGYGNVTVGYEHGMDQPPERVRRAAMLLAKVWLVSGPVDDRATSFSSTETGATYSMVVPGRGGSITGVPEVDAVIQQYRIPALV